MEDKVKRESKTYIDKLFKKYDHLSAGAINRNDMRKIMDQLIANFADNLELDEKMDAHAKAQKYTTLNTKTRTMEVQYLEDSLDFPSVMAIAVSFLNKYERRNTNAFASKGLITFHDLPVVTASTLNRQVSMDGKRRLF